MTRVYLSFFLFLLTLSPLTAKQEYGVLTFSKESYTVGINVFEGKNLSDESLFLAQSIPQLLMQEVKECREHVLFIQEREILQDEIVSEKMKSLNKKLQTEYSRRDDLIFESGNVRPEYRKIKKTISDLEEEIEFYSGYNPRDIDLPEALDIEFKTLSVDKPLLDKEEWDRTTRNPESLDMLIYGNIEQYGDYLYVTVLMYNSIIDKEELIFQDAISVSGSSLMVRQAAESLLSFILGREWSRLEVACGEEDSFLYLDGELVGIKSVDSPLFTPGEHTLEVTASGFKPFQQTLVLEPYQSLSVDVELAPSLIEYISINSVPVGADIYLGSLWMGKTPLLLPRPEKEMLLTISSEGYITHKGMIGPLSDKRVDVELPPGEIDYFKVLDKRKKSFYTSLGFFSLSLIPPVILWQLYINSNYYAYSNSDYRLYSDAFLGCFIGSLVVSAGVLTYMIVRLIQYIKAAEDTAR